MNSSQRHIIVETAGRVSGVIAGKLGIKPVDVRNSRRLRDLGVDGYNFWDIIAEVESAEGIYMPVGTSNDYTFLSPMTSVGDFKKAVIACKLGNSR